MPRLLPLLLLCTLLQLAVPVTAAGGSSPATPAPATFTIGERSANVHQEGDRIVMAFDDKQMAYVYTRNGGFLSGAIGAGADDLQFAMQLVAEWEARGGGQAESTHRGGPFLPIGAFLVGLGALGYIMPQMAWRLTTGWRSDDVAPSPRALVAHRAIAGLVAIIGLLLLVP